MKWLADDTRQDPCSKRKTPEGLGCPLEGRRDSARWKPRTAAALRSARPGERNSNAPPGTVAAGGKTATAQPGLDRTAIDNAASRLCPGGVGTARPADSMVALVALSGLRIGELLAL